MENYQRNPMHELSPNYTWADYKTFKAHLMIPLPYLRVALKNFSPNEAVFNLHRVIRKYNEHLWRQRMNPSFKEKLYQVANIPPQYHAPQMFICEKPADQENMDFVIENVKWLANNGKQFYLYGPFIEEPMKAATAIARACVDNSVKCYCENFPAFLDTIKTWDLESETLRRIRTTQVLILWAIGGEYSTEFTTVNLDALLSIRTANNLTTVLVSSLTPKEYYTRYKSEPTGITVGFKGMKIKETMSMLVKEMKN
jgi:DNA replication protein DnaC